MIKQILSQNAHWQINKKFAREFGLETALLISDLIDKKTYFENREELVGDGWFYNTSENIERDTGISYHKQKTAIKILVENGFLEIKKQGMPLKKYFKINDKNLSDFFISKNLKIQKLDSKKFKNKSLKNLHTSSLNFYEHDSKNFKVNNNKLNNNKSIKNKEKKINNDFDFLKFEDFILDIKQGEFFDFFCDFFAVKKNRVIRERILSEIFRKLNNEKESVDEFKNQFYAYVEYKKITGEQKHRAESFIISTNEIDYITLLEQNKSKENGKKYVAGRQTREDVEQNANGLFDAINSTEL